MREDDIVSFNDIRRISIETNIESSSLLDTSRINTAYEWDKLISSAGRKCLKAVAIKYLLSGLGGGLSNQSFRQQHSRDESETWDPLRWNSQTHRGGLARPTAVDQPWQSHRGGPDHGGPD